MNEYIDLVIYGYAPGNYFNRCVVCDEKFHGDKRAVTCIECAREYEKCDRELLDEM